MGKSMIRDKKFKIVSPVLPQSHTMLVGLYVECALSTWKAPASLPSF